MRDKKFFYRLYVVIPIFLLISLFIVIFLNQGILRRPVNSKTSTHDIYFQSMQYANTFWGAGFPKLTLKEVVTDSLYETNFDKPTVLILFSGSDCRDCVRDELRLINSLNDYNINKKDYNIVAIGITPSKLEILTFRKITQTNYTYLFDSEKKFERIFDIHELPLIFIISPKNMILSAYYPIPGDRILSELFFDGFINLLKGMVEGATSIMELP